MILLELLGELFPYILTGVCIGIYVLITRRRGEARWGYRIRRGRRVITGLRIGRLYVGWGTACILGPYHSCMINRGVRIGWLLWKFEVIRRVDDRIDGEDVGEHGAFTF